MLFLLDVGAEPLQGLAWANQSRSSRASKRRQLWDKTDHLCELLGLTIYFILWLNEGFIPSTYSLTLFDKWILSSHSNKGIVPSSPPGSSAGGSSSWLSQTWASHRGWKTNQWALMILAKSAWPVRNIGGWPRSCKFKRCLPCGHSPYFFFFFFFIHWVSSEGRPARIAVSMLRTPCRLP